MLVQTIKGLIERSELTAVDEIQENDNDRAIVTTWLYKGELVRQDAHVSILRGLPMDGEQANI